MHNKILSSVPHSHKMPLFKFVVLTIYTMPNLYYKALEVIQLSSQTDDIMSKAVADQPMEQVGLMFTDNSWGSLCIPKSKYVITAIMNLQVNLAILVEGCLLLFVTIVNRRFSVVRFGSNTKP